PFDLFPRLGDDARGLEQHAAKPKTAFDLHREVWLDPEALRGIAMALLDPALGVEPVAAHVPFAAGTGRAWNGIGPPHDADHVIAGLQFAAAGRLQHTPKRFVPDDQPRRSRRRRPVVAGVDLVIGAADADGERLHEDSAVRGRRLWHLIEPRGTGDARG